MNKCLHIGMRSIHDKTCKNCGQHIGILDRCEMSLLPQEHGERWLRDRKANIIEARVRCQSPFYTYYKQTLSMLTYIYMYIYIYIYIHIYIYIYIWKRFCNIQIRPTFFADLFRYIPNARSISLSSYVAILHACVVVCFLRQSSCTSITDGSLVT
jgi:hypothetical protein